MTPDLLAALSAALREPIRSATPVPGGDINRTLRLEAGGRTAFAKLHDHAPPDFFEAEADGLARLSATGALRVPAVLALGRAGPTAYLCLEWIAPGPEDRRVAQRLGEGLARLHRTASSTFGLERDNYIGSLPQPNRPTPDWVAFFRDQRLGAQLEQGRRRGTLPAALMARLERLQVRLGDWLGHGPEPALLHGDLWRGNAMADSQGRPVLVDPAVYWGDREAELAFTTLFGGFDRAFYAAYQASWPLPPGFEERRDLYNLYPLLVHANLFGGGYVGRVGAIIRRYLGP